MWETGNKSKHVKLSSCSLRHKEACYTFHTSQTSSHRILLSCTWENLLPSTLFLGEWSAPHRFTSSCFGMHSPDSSMSDSPAVIFNLIFPATSSALLPQVWKNINSEKKRKFRCPHKGCVRICILIGLKWTWTSRPLICQLIFLQLKTLYEEH